MRGFCRVLCLFQLLVVHRELGGGCRVYNIILYPMVLSMVALINQPLLSEEGRLGKVT